MLTQNEVLDSGEEFIQHVGVAGMKWGHRKGKSNSGKAKSPSRLSKITPHQKKAAFVIVTTGATVAAGIIVGPMGLMTVSAISNALREVAKVK